MGSEPPKYLVIHKIIFLRNFVYFILFAWSKVGLVKKILKWLGKVAWFQYKTGPQKNKSVSQKKKNKNFVKKRITQYFGGLDPMNELLDKKTTYLVIFEHGCIRIDLFVLCEGHANKLKERLGDRCLTQQPVKSWQN